MKAGILPPSPRHVLHRNGVLVAGLNEGGKLATGAKGNFMLPFPQAVENMTNVKQVAIGAGGSATFLHWDGSISTLGVNPGNGTHNRPRETVNVEDPTLVRGGPLYLEKTVAQYHYTLPADPRAGERPKLVDGSGRVLISIASLCTSQTSTCFAVTTDGRVLTWGLSYQGQLGSGYENGENWVVSAKKEQYPQFAPWWVQTAGPPQQEAPAEGEKAKGWNLLGAGSSGARIVQAASAFRCAFFLRADGRWFVTGKPSGWTTGEGKGGASLYAEEDPMCTAHFAAIVAEIGKPIAIAASRECLLLLGESGKVAYIGNLKYGLAAAPVSEEHLVFRYLAYPLDGLGGSKLTNVVAVALTNSSAHVIKSEGEHRWLYSWGDNNVGQLGLGLGQTKIVSKAEVEAEEVLLGAGNAKKTVGEEAPVEVAYPTKVELDAEGHALNNVSAVAAGAYYSGGGNTGGDTVALLLADGTVRATGANYTYANATQGWRGIGQMADYTSEDRRSFVKPPVSGIVSVATGGEALHMIQEPGTAGVPVLQLHYVPGGLTVTWLTAAGTVGSLPVIRKESGWIVTVKNASTKKQVFKSPLQAESVGASGRFREYVAPIVLEKGVTYEVEVESEYEQQVVGEGANGRGIRVTSSPARLISPTWTSPAKAEAALVVETRLAGTYPGKESVTTETTAPLEAGEEITEIEVGAIEGGKLQKKVTLENIEGEKQTFVLTHAGKESTEGQALTIEPATVAFDFPEGTLVQQGLGFTSTLAQSVAVGTAYSRLTLAAVGDTTPGGTPGALQGEANEQPVVFEPALPTVSTTLTGGITNGATVEELKVAALSGRRNGTVLVTNGSGESQLFTMSETAASGATSIKVKSAKASATFAAGNVALVLTEAVYKAGKPTLSEAVAGGSSVTEIPIQPLFRNLWGEVLIENEAKVQQTFVLSEPALAGATVLKVVKATAVSTFALGTTVLQTTTFVNVAPFTALYDFPEESSAFALAIAVAKLRTALSSAGPTTTLPVESLPYDAVSGSLVSVSSPSTSPSYTQTFRLAAKAREGDSVLTVESTTPVFSFPAGSTVVPCLRERYRRVAEVAGTAKTASGSVPTARHGVGGGVVVHLDFLGGMFNGIPYFVLQVEPLTAPGGLPNGSTITLNDGAGHTQVWTLKLPAKQGDEEISVVEQKTNFAYPYRTRGVSNCLDCEVLVVGAHRGSTALSPTGGMGPGDGSYVSGVKMVKGAPMKRLLTVA